MFVSWTLVVIGAVFVVAWAQDDAAQKVAPLHPELAQVDEAKETSCVETLKKRQPKLSERFTNMQLARVCQREAVWEDFAKRPTGLAPKPFVETLTVPQREYVDHVWSCNEDNCFANTKFVQPCSISSRLCPLARSKSIRKEYRRLTDAERTTFHEALNALKSTLIDGVSKYDLMTGYHHPSQSPGAHFGPSFLPWHREYLYRMEVALKLERPALVGLPYWDSILDRDLPNAAHSIIWTPSFLGNPSGAVTTGPFRCWRATTAIGDPLYLYRNIGVDTSQSALYSQADLDWILAQTSFDALTYCVDPTMEALHGGPHVYIGGHMSSIIASPNDPVFFLHHTFIDHLWERFRLTKQTATQRQTDYTADGPDSCSNPVYYGSSIMLPFTPKKNTDGLSNSYTNTLYSYDPMPTCTVYNQSCGSPYLFCDTSTFTCKSKVRAGGSCVGYESKPICYGGSCVGGTCSGKVPGPGLACSIRIIAPQPIPIPIPIETPPVELANPAADSK